MRAVVVAQLVEGSLPIPEVHSLNPVIGKIYTEHLLLTVEETKIKKKETGNGPFKKLNEERSFLLVKIGRNRCQFK